MQSILINLMSPIPSISMLALATTCIGGVVGAYLFAPALRVASISRHYSVATTLSSTQNKQTIQGLPSMEYREEDGLTLIGTGSDEHVKVDPHISTDTVLLSLIIPAYNEEQRLPHMLQHTIQNLVDLQIEIIDLCHQALPDTFSSCNVFEIIIVNDGSKDQTIAYTQQLLHSMIQKKGWTTSSCPTLVIRFITLIHNRGKGAAVQLGMLQSHGKLCLMLDADGATDFSSGILLLLQRLVTMTRRNPPMSTIIPCLSVYGSRAHLQENNSQHIQRSWARIILMHAFHLFVRTLCSSKIKDTQCGFKLFTQPAAQLLFTNLHLQRWAFDIELVVMSDMLNIPVEEVSVTWQEVEGSKLATSKFALIRASMDMLRDMICVRLCYGLGIWKIQRE